MSSRLSYGSTSSRMKLRLRRGSGAKQKSLPGRDTVKRDLENFLQDKITKGSKVSRRREKIITEIFASERRYQEQLRVVIEVFMNPLKNRGILPEGIFKTIFGDLTAIQSINKELLAHMEETSIGQAFMQLAPYIKLYCTYANNFDHAMLTLQEWERKTSEFAQFLREQEAKEECRSLSLHALLITPVQRVPRYKLLLEQLVDHTTPGNEDYTNLKEAAQLIGQVTLGINEYIREHENFQKMLEIQKKLSGPGTPKILIPGRRFIREGYLMKVSRKGFGSQERMFFLFSDMLIYAKPNMVLERPLSPRTFTCRLAIPIEICEVQLVLGEKNIKNTGALFRLSYGDESLLLYSTDSQEALGWIDALQGAIQTLRSNTASLRRTSSVTIEAMNEVLQPLYAETPLRYSLRPRNKQKVAQVGQKEISPKNKDSLYPMRKQVLKANMMTSQRTPLPPKESIPDIPMAQTEEHVVMRSKKSRSKGSQSRRRSPFLRNKRQRKSLQSKSRRLERGPLSLKPEAPEEPPTMYEDAFADLPDDGNATEDFTFHTVYGEENFPELQMNNDPRRMSYRNYEDRDHPSRLGSSFEDKQQSLCTIL